MIWLFPILFMLHDFEEIIFLPPWLHKNKPYLSDRFPKLSGRLFEHFDNITPASFTLGVAEEFLLISVITFISTLTHNYYLWMGLFIAFNLHLISHLIQSCMVGKYFPALVTSLISLPIGITILIKVITLFSWLNIILYGCLGITIMVVNLVIVHKGMDHFSRWLS